ncbi:MULTISPECIES: RHS repeat-associated core domain-containing protein [unclassified Pseudomonas]|uniref:RHS repeat-associated core domain-containing protein n=1 Tax=unclassified Pseudomonas TaxID=196821 RepID=UPI00111833FB|nr:RHS repeat-associated core domain-containing protein [Pseudomonas sp. CCOS 191]MBI6955239.1 RHS repeat-associated core domain-containing protein [Pseudomonas sp. CCOS 191]
MDTALLSADIQGSVLLRHTGVNQYATTYCAYGHTPVSTEKRLLGFNSERIELATIYLLGNGYRAFHPVLMRFGSPDSASPFNAGGINNYAYCQADPVNRKDPDGHMWRRIQTFLRGPEPSAISAASLTVPSPSAPEITTQGEFNSAQPAGLPHYFGGFESPPPYSPAPAPDPRSLSAPTFDSPTYSPVPKPGEVVLEVKNNKFIEVESLVGSILTSQTLANPSTTSGFARLRATNTRVAQIRNSRPLQTDSGILEAFRNGQALSRVQTGVQEG